MENSIQQYAIDHQAFARILFHALAEITRVEAKEGTVLLCTPCGNEVTARFVESAKTRMFNGDPLFLCPACRVVVEAYGRPYAEEALRARIAAREGASPDKIQFVNN